MIIACTGIAGAWMRIPHTVQILIMIMGLDVLSGIIAAVSTQTLNSSVMARGLFKKLAVFPLLALLHITEKPLALPFEFESMAALAFIAYEAMSIVENCALAGVPIPKVIVSFLAKAKVSTASPDDIKREFSTTTMSTSTTSEIVKTPDSQPDIKVDKVVTIVEQQHISPVPPETTPKT